MPLLFILLSHYPSGVTAVGVVDRAAARGRSTRVLPRGREPMMAQCVPSSSGMTAVCAMCRAAARRPPHSGPAKRQGASDGAV